MNKSTQQRLMRAAKRLLFRMRTLLDVFAMVIATPLAFLVRYDGAIPVAAIPALATATVLLSGLKYIGYASQRLHTRSWTRVTFRDLSAIGLTLLVTALVGTLVLVWFGPLLNIPRSIALIDGLLALGLMSAMRASARYRHENRMSKSVVPEQQRRVLIIGAGEAGSMIARELKRHPETGLKPVGFLDDDPGKVGQLVASVPVLGTIGDAGNVLHKHPIDEVLISMPSQHGATVRKIIGTLEQVKPNLTYKIIPGMYELLSGKVAIKRIREVEIEDLLGRQPVRLDTDQILDYLQGKTVMITGAGGSIGSELVRQICRFNPKKLILFGHGENSIYSLERELDRVWPDIAYHSVIGAIQNGTRLAYIFRRFKPDVVFHAAAHKHVPLMELNPEEAIFNNVIGSRNLVTLAREHGVSHFVNISTDKAVNPTSVMGASKRMVEFIVQDAAAKAKPDQVFVSVRFGNVLGSRGSVIPLFKSQIKAGGPVTVTHQDMVRYFMTIPEASQLVLQASGQGNNGETYILNMGEPVRILDLAKDLIRLSGFEPDEDIPIVFTGMRPGEKLYEELMAEGEENASTAHEKIFVATSSSFRSEDLDAVIQRLQEAALVSDHAMIRHYLQEFIQGCTVAERAGVVREESETTTSSSL